MRIGLVLLAIGLLGAVLLVREWWAADASRQWPTVTGTVFVSRLDEGQTVRPRTRFWTPRVEFRYEIDGREYTSDRIRFGSFPSTSIREEGEAIVRRYAIRSQHAVAYDPDDPSVGVLEPGAGAARGGLMLGAAIDGLVLGLGALFVFGRRRRPSRPSDPAA